MEENHFFLHLNPNDNVIVIIRDVRENTVLEMGSKTIAIKSHIALGHKIAIKEINPGDQIIKCGTPIGSATKVIQPGEHVHLHNMKSDYIPTYTFNNRFNG